MIETKENLVGSIVETETISGEVNKEIVVIEPTLQEKSTTPIEEPQIITPDIGFDGLSQVNVAAIPSEYVIPSGTLEITQNGEYDVTNYASANIETSGVDINEYFGTTMTANSSADDNPLIIKKMLPLTIADNVTSSNRLFQNLKLFTNELPVVYGGKNIVNMQYMYSCGTEASNDRVTEIDASHLETDKVQYIDSMFYGRAKLQRIIGMNNWNITKAVTANNMFYYCRALISVDLSGIDFSTIVQMNSFFNYCDNLEEITTAQTFDTSSCTDFGSMFSNAIKIPKSFISKLNTTKATTLNYMFNNWASTTAPDTNTSLDLSNFYTPALKNCSNMFAGCRKLTHIDIRNMTFDTVTSYSNMFGSSASNGVPNNCEIIVKGDTEKTWLKGKFSRLTNIKTVAEYEG